MINLLINKRIIIKQIIFIILITQCGCAIMIETFNLRKKSPQQKATSFKSVIYKTESIDYIKNALSHYAPVNISPDISHLGNEDLMALQYILDASAYIQRIYYSQVFDKNNLLFNELKQTINTPNQVYYDFFHFMSGPWNKDDNNKPFINDYTKLPGANFYPNDMTRAEFETWIATHPEDKQDFLSSYTIIRRDTSRLKAIPYTEFFQSDLNRAARRLMQAAHVTKDKSLATYLTARANEFIHYKSNMNRESDIAWLKLNGDIEVSLGPHEVYDDSMFEYKAGFHSFIGIVDRFESQKLKNLELLMPYMEKYMPLPENHKTNQHPRKLSIKVVNELYSSGLYRYYSPTAFNYPNDPWVLENIGSKQIMIKNVLHAKYSHISNSIAEKLLTPKTFSNHSFEAVFNIILLHEITHALGPGIITVNGVKAPVSQFLKEHTWTIEECKADVVGIFNILELMKLGAKNPLPKSLFQTLFPSYLVRLLRNIRFGKDSAHGRAVMIQMNYHLQNHGFVLTQQGRFYINAHNLIESIQKLSQTILTIQATGNYSKADQLIKQFAIETPQIKIALNAMTDIPIDIMPCFSLVEKTK